MKLIIRGDDAGNSLSANRAIEQCVAAGLLRNVSVMAVGSFVDDAARRLASLPGVCVGLHVTLNSEFLEPRFRPLLPPSRVASLIGDDDCFLPEPADLHRRGFALEDAVAEVVAQLRRLRSLKLDVRYLDEHMGVGWLPGLADRLRDLCGDEGLVYARDAADPLPAVGQRPDGSRVEGWLARVAAACSMPSARPALLVTHPMLDDEEARAMHGPCHPTGTVASDRDGDRRALLDPRLGEGLQSLGVHPIRYDEAALQRTTP